MSGRTIAIGDIHGDLDHLERLFERLPWLDAGDTIVFIGDYVDRGPDSAGAVAFVRRLPEKTAARVVALRGNHEDAWIRVRREKWKQFVLPADNGCLATLRSYAGGPVPVLDELPTADEFKALIAADFFAEGDFEWMESLPAFHEDDHAIYVHAGLPRADGRFLHPSEVADVRPLFWQRDAEFFRNYRGKRVVFGHTPTERLPQELSQHTPGDDKDLFLGESIVGIDTGCGHGGFLTAVELPGLVVHESR
jgi:serine/threonine protein phosphatase 1